MQHHIAPRDGVLFWESGDSIGTAITCCRLEGMNRAAALGEQKSRSLDDIFLARAGRATASVEEV